MVAPVYGLPISDPSVAAYFTNGEEALAPTSDAAVTGVNSYYMARRLLLSAGSYTVKIYTDDAATMWVGTGLTSSRMVLSTDVTLGVRIYEFQVYEGETRIDLYLQNLSNAPGYCYAVLSIFRDGALVYASNADDWQFTTDTPMADDLLQGLGDTRRSLPVFSVPPNWRDGINERLTWLTDILTDEDGTGEQRRSLRTLPRRTIEAGFLRKGAYRARLQNFFTGQGSKPFLVPLWFEQYRLPASLAASATGLTFPTGTLTMREFRAGDLVLLQGSDPDVFDVAIISTINLATDTITWEIKPTRTWPRGTRVIPLRRAIMTERPSFANNTDDVSSAQARFELADPDSGFEPSWGYCSPLFQLKPNWSESLTVDFDRTTYTLSNDVANSFIVDPSDMTLLGRRAGFLLRGRERVNAFRRFITMARGRAVRFWMPTFTQDIVPAEDIGGSSFEALPAGYWETMQTRQLGSYKIAIAFRDGSPSIYHDVVAIEPVGLEGPPYTMSGERYYVSPELPPIARDRIARISWIQPVRFDQDAFEIQHDTDESNVVRVSLVTRVVDGTGMPPIDCWVTSPTYPQEVAEGMSLDATLLTGALYESLQRSTDSMNLDVTLLPGTLSVVLQSVNEVEAVNLDAALLDGMLKVVLLSTSQTEAMNFDATLQSGTLDVALISYHHDAQAMNFDVTLLNGTLQS